MKRQFTLKLLIAAAAVWACAAPPLEAAQYVYPAKGQSAARMSKDKAQCRAWAVKSTGFDPSTPPPPPVSSAPVTGSGARVAGAAGGAAIAGISGGNAGTGALVGAAAGGMTRRIRNRRAADQQNAANMAAYNARQADYRHARAACLTGRGYTVR